MKRAKRKENHLEIEKQADRERSLENCKLCSVKDSRLKPYFWFIFQQQKKEVRKNNIKHCLQSLDGFFEQHMQQIKVNIIASFRPFKASQIGWMMYSGFFVIVCSTVFVSLRLVKSEFLTIKLHTISQKSEISWN